MKRKMVDRDFIFKQWLQKCILNHNEKWREKKTLIICRIESETGLCSHWNKAHSKFPNSIKWILISLFVIFFNSYRNERWVQVISIIDMLHRDTRTLIEWDALKLQKSERHTIKLQLKVVITTTELIENISHARQFVSISKFSITIKKENSNAFEIVFSYSFQLNAFNVFYSHFRMIYANIILLLLLRHDMILYSHFFIWNRISSFYFYLYLVKTTMLFIFKINATHLVSHFFLALSFLRLFKSTDQMRTKFVSNFFFV